MNRNRFALIAAAFAVVFFFASPAAGQVSGMPEVRPLVYGTPCPEHPTEHGCPAENADPVDCWWQHHCCIDEHGHVVTPFLPLIADRANRLGIRPECGAAAHPERRAGRWYCIPHRGTRIAPGAVYRACMMRRAPGDPTAEAECRAREGTGR